MKRAFIALVAAAICACAPQPASQPAPPQADAVQDQVAELWTAETRAVLTGFAARALASQCSRGSPGPIETVWIPTDAEIEAMEDELILLVSSELEKNGESA